MIVPITRCIVEAPEAYHVVHVEILIEYLEVLFLRHAADLALVIVAFECFSALFVVTWAVVGGKATIV